MQEDFDLETILTITTGINLTDDFNKVFELAWFVFDDPYINVSGIYFLQDSLKEYILHIYPELADITEVPKFKYSQKYWLEEQKIKFGKVLPIIKTKDNSISKKSKTLVKNNIL